MSPRLPILVLVVGFAFGPGAWAVDVKVGYVDFERVAENAPQIAEGRVQLEAEFRTRNEALEAEERRLQEMEERLLRDAAIMSEAQAQGLERDVRSLRRQVQRDREDMVDEFNFRLNEVQQEVEKEIEEIVRRFAQENGYDLILITEILYVSDEVDITADVIEILKNEYQTPVSEEAQ